MFNTMSTEPIYVFPIDKGSLLDVLPNYYLEQNCIYYTDKPEQADIITSPWFNNVCNYIQKFRETKGYLVWSIEPIWDLLSGAPVDRKIVRLTLSNHLEIKVHVMNSLAGNVFFNNYWYLKECLDLYEGAISQIKSDTFFSSSILKAKKTAAMLSCKAGPSLSFFRKGEEKSLCNLRVKIALYGFYSKKLELYGSGWPNGMSKEDSRNLTRGERVARKIKILKDYAFNLSLENVVAPFYVSEKIWDSIAAGCLPIYYAGNDHTIYQDFPCNSFIDYADFNNEYELFKKLDTMSESEYKYRLKLCVNSFDDALEKVKYGLDPQKICFEHTVKMLRLIKQELKNKKEGISIRNNTDSNKQGSGTLF